VHWGNKHKALGRQRQPALRSSRCHGLRPVSGLASGLHLRSTFPCSRTVVDLDRVYSLTVAGAAPELRSLSRTGFPILPWRRMLQGHLKHGQLTQSQASKSS